MSYKFCKNMYTMLAFHCNYSNKTSTMGPCCNENNDVFPQMNYSGGSINIKSYKEYIQRVLNELQGETNLCRACPYLMEYPSSPSEQERNFQIQVVSLSINANSCHCRCIYCPQKTSPGNNGFPAMPILESLAEHRLLSTQTILVWGGGEPTLVPDFAVACKYLREYGVRQHFYTNAVVEQPEIIRTLREGKGEILLSLDSGNRATYRAVKGIDAFDRVLKNLRAYKQASFNDTIILKYIIIEENANRTEIDAFFNLCRELEIKRVAYSGNINRNFRQLEPSETVVDAVEYFRSVAAAHDLACEDRTQLHVGLYIDQGLVKRKREAIARIAAPLAGKKVVFWGGGEAYVAFAGLFAESRPLTLLQTFSSSHAPSPSALTLPVLHPEQFFRERQSRNKLPFVFFCREENKKIFRKNMEPWLDRAEGEIVWCTL